MLLCLTTTTTSTLTTEGARDCIGEFNIKVMSASNMDSTTSLGYTIVTQITLDSYTIFFSLNNTFTDLLL